MMKKSLKISIIAFAAAVFLAGLGAWWVASIAYAKYPGSEPVRVYVPTGATEEQLCDSLAARLGSDFAAPVMRLWRWGRGAASRSAGSYVINPGDNALSVSKMLRHGHQTPVRVTFTGGRTLQQAAERLCAGLEAEASDVLAVCDTLLPQRGYAPADYPAVFLPDTYEFYWNASPERVAKRMLAATEAFWTDERKQKASALGLTPAQVSTLASIVEEETAKAGEMPTVARLYLNRLQQGMLLQADPTVKYAVGDPTLRRILHRHLEVESPYNTYKHAGLPPGPIRVPSKIGIDAVLNAPMHGFLYMCAKEDFSGYHNFAVTLAEHNANAARYQRELNRRGIR